MVSGVGSKVWVWFKWFSNWIIFAATGRLNFQWNSLLRHALLVWYDESGLFQLHWQRLENKTSSTCKNCGEDSNPTRGHGRSQSKENLNSSVLVKGVKNHTDVSNIREILISLFGCLGHFSTHPIISDNVIKMKWSITPFQRTTKDNRPPSGVPAPFAWRRQPASGRCPACPEP